MKTSEIGCGAWLIAISVVVSVIAAISAAMGALFMLLWNFAVAPAFQTAELDFLPAWALWVLICLVGSVFRGRGTSSKKD